MSGTEAFPRRKQTARWRLCLIDGTSLTGLHVARDTRKA